MLQATLNLLESSLEPTFLCFATPPLATAALVVMRSSAVTLLLRAAMVTVNVKVERRGVVAVARNVRTATRLAGLAAMAVAAAEVSVAVTQVNAAGSAVTT